jgi:hypothetical protein
MGASGQLYHLPLPSGAEPAATDVDLRVGRAGVSDMGNTSATTFAGKVVGDSITELNDIELYGLKLIAGSMIFSCTSIVADLNESRNGPATSKMRYRNF